MLMHLKRLSQSQNRVNAVHHDDAHKETCAHLNNEGWNANLNSQAPHALA
jgi:hypothetical protein